MNCLILSNILKKIFTFVLPSMLFSTKSAVFLMQQYHFRRLVIHIRHCCTDGCSNIGWVADGEASAVKLYVVTIYTIIKAYRSGKMPGIEHQYNIKSKQVSHKTRKQYGAVLAVAVWIVSITFPLQRRRGRAPTPCRRIHIQMPSAPS